MIGVSVGLEQGMVLVDQAVATMTEIVASIKWVPDIMGRLSVASIAHGSGVAKVGDAVRQVDQAMQQNAALVGESAAAAESQRGQAQQLMQSLALFKINQGGTAAPAAAASDSGADRRGRDGAQNLARPRISAKSNPPSTVTGVSTLAAARTGTDGVWSSF